MRGPVARPLVLWGERAAAAGPLDIALAALRPAPIPSGRTAPPHGATVIVPGLDAWAGRWPALLKSRPDLRTVAVLDAPLAWEWPEFEPQAAGAAADRARMALAAAAALVLLPDTAAVATIHDRLGPEGPRLVVEPVPSGLAGTAALPAEEPPEGPFMLALGPIEARSNALLLLQVWRDGLARGLALPRLILAGRRGLQIEDIAPLLDWNPALKRHVTEAPGLDGPALRRLITTARAVLAPDFAAPPAALLRDAQALGAPVIAADTPHARALGFSARLSPLDGPGWRAAILAAADRPPAPSRPVPPLLDWPGYAARLVAHAQALP